MIIIIFLLGFIAGSLVPLYDGFLDFIASKIKFARREKKS